MEEDVRKQRPHEQKRRRAWILDADDAGLPGPPKVSRHDLQSPARGAVDAARVERHEERGVGLFVHAQHEVLPDRRPGERHPLLGDTAQDDPRIGRGVHVLQVGDAGRKLDVAVHGRVEQRLLGVEVAEDGRRGDVQLRGDVGERGRSKPFLGEYVARGLEDLLPMDARRSSHL